MTDRYYSIALTLLVAFGGVLRFWGIERQLFIHRDDSAILEFAQQLIRTHQFGWTQARPTWVAIVAAAYQLTGSPAASAYVSWAASVATLLVTALLAKVVVGPRAALLAVAVLAGSSISSFYARSQQPMAFTTLLATIATLAIVYSWKANTSSRSLLWLGIGSATLGVAITTHPTLFILPPVIVVCDGWWCLRSHQGLSSGGLKRVARRWLVMVAATLAPLALLELLSRRAPVSYMQQFLAGFEVQRDFNSNVSGIAELSYYVLGLVATEGAVATTLVIAAAMFLLWSWLKAPRLDMFFMLSQAVGLVLLWSGAGASGVVNHMRIVLPFSAPLAVIMGAALVALVDGLAARLRPRASSILTGLLVLICAAGLVSSWPVMIATTGYYDAARALESNDLVVVSGSKGRNLSVVRPGMRVEEVEHLSSVIVSSGGIRCGLAIDPAIVALGVSGSNTALRALEFHFGLPPGVRDTVPITSVPSSHSALPIFRLESVDTGVQQLAAIIMNGMRIPVEYQRMDVIQLNGGADFGCRGDLPRS